MRVRLTTTGPAFAWLIQLDDGTWFQLGLKIKLSESTAEIAVKLARIGDFQTIAPKQKYV